MELKSLDSYIIPMEGKRSKAVMVLAVASADSTVTVSSTRQYLGRYITT